MQESRFYVKVNAHRGSSAYTVYAPFLCSLQPLQRTSEALAVLSNDEGTAEQGLYIWRVNRWQFLLDQKIISDAVHRGQLVSVYYNLTEPVEVKGTVYRNGQLIDTDTLSGNAYFVVLGSPSISTINGQGPDAEGNLSIDSAFVGAVDLDQLGVPGGVATLDEVGTLNISQVPHWLLGVMQPQGQYDASLNQPPLPEPSNANNGWYWIVSVPGTQYGLDLEVGDWIVSTGTSYVEIDNQPSEVRTVNGFGPDGSGNVKLVQYANYSVSVPNAPEPNSVVYYQDFSDTLEYLSGQASCKLAPSDAMSFNILLNGVPIGTIDFLLGSTTGTVNVSFSGSITPGDTLEILAPENLYGSAVFSFVFNFERI